MNHKAKPAACIGAVTAAIILAVSLYLTGRGSGGENVVYKEAKVEYGSLTVGITKEASVSVGTLEQKFDLDISALVDSSSSSDSSTVSGAMPPGAGTIPSGAGGTGSAGMMAFGSSGTAIQASQSQSLEVEGVMAAVGQEIKEGTPLYTLTSESVDEIRAELSADIDDTRTDYEALKASQEESRTLAKQSYDTYVTTGKYAQLVYEDSLKTYQEAMDKAAEDVDGKQDSYNEKMLELAELQNEYAEAGKLLREAQGAVSENYEGRYGNAYYYTVYLNTQQAAQKLYNQLEDDIESRSKEIEQLLLDIQTAVRALNQSRRDYEQAKLDLGKTRDIDAYYAGMAAEWYDIQTSSLDNELSAAKKSYESAMEKLEAFDSRVQNNKILSGYSGVVTEMHLAEGGKLSGGSSLVTLNDGGSVTMDVSVGGDDYDKIDIDGAINIVFASYPDKIFSGRITEVSDAEYDSSSASVYYTLTVAVQGEVSGLYEGMTGDVTLVTKEMKDVCYVSNRAVFREGAKSYVRVRDENGNIVKQEIVTGFSDGINVEIISGLSEGDTVLITVWEDKVGN